MPSCGFSGRARLKRSALEIAFAVLLFSAAARGAEPSPTPSSAADSLEGLPVRELTISTAKESARVGDFLTYELSPGPGGDDAIVSPQAGGWKAGVSFRANRVVIPLVAGKHVLPALPIVDREGRVVAKTDPIEMTIESTVAQEQGQDGKPPEPAPARGPLDVSAPGWIQTAAGGFIGVLFAMLLFYAIRWSQRRAARLMKKILPAKPIDQRALDRLQELQKRGLIAKGQHKAYHFGVSETLKEYLGARFGFDAQESTTSELIEGLKERQGAPGLDATVVRKIAETFAVLDLVKFTDYVPTQKESDAQGEAARNIVLTTRRASSETGLLPPNVGNPSREAQR